MAQQPQPPAPPARPPQPAQPARPQAPPQRQSHEQEPSPEQRTGLGTEPHPPQKYDRPLPQPGDKDYVVGQPVNDEEADRVEKEQDERYAAAQKAAQEVEAKRRDEEKSHEKD